MNSSKKFMTRILTAALALSMVAGTTGVCASAVEDTTVEEEPIVIMAPEDYEQVELSKLDTLKAILETAAKNAYAKLSTTTAAQLLQVAQKAKMSQKIMIEAATQASAIQTEAYTKVSEIMAEATDAASNLEDEEAAAQIMQEATQKAEAIMQEADEQASQLMSQAQEASDALLAEADEQLNAIRAQVQEKKMQTIAEIQQKLYDAKTQIKTLTEKISDYISNKTVKICSLADDEFAYDIVCGIKGVSAVAVYYYGSESEEVTVPDYVRGIPVESVMLLSSANIKTLNLPMTVKNVSGLSAAVFHELENINVDELNPYLQSVDGIVFDKTGTVLYAVPQGREYNIPEGITAVGDFAYYMSKISSIEIPSTVTSIGEGAFQYCLNLQKAFVPASVQTIGKLAFDQVSDDFVIDLETVSCQAYVYVRVNNIAYNCPLAASISLESDTNFVDDSEHFVATTLGSTITATGTAEGGSKEGYLYAFYIRKEGDTKWACKQGFKENDSITFKPEFTGNYEICVKIKDSTGTVAKMYMDLFILNGFENTSTVSSDTIKKGQTVTVNCSADGVEAEDVSYAVYYKKTTDKKWVTKQDYDSNTEVTIKPAKAADYTICVKAKTSDGTISKKYFTVKVEA